MRAGILLSLLTTCLFAQPGSVEGTVVNHANGEPIPGVHVRLLTGDFDSGGIDQVYGSISDRAGHFSVTGLKAGLYIVFLERSGYLQVQTSGLIPIATIALKAGQNITGQKLEMNVRALLMGRVVDEYGDPVQNVGVRLQPVPPDKPQESLFGSGFNTTDDRGEFRLMAAPGRYYIEANPRTFSRVELQMDGSPTAAFGTTFFPSASTTGAASVVQAAAGQDVAGLEIRLLRGAVGAKAGSLTISGVVSGAPDCTQASVNLHFGESADRLYNSRGTTAAPDGKFSVSGLSPGTYRVSARCTVNKVRLQSQMVDLQLSGSDQPGVQLILAPGGEISGTVEFSGEVTAAALSEKRTVRLEQADRSYFDDSGAAPAEVDKSGAFRIPNIPAGRFRFTVDPLPDNGFLKSLTVDGTPAPDFVVDFSRGAANSRVKIVVSLSGGQISGKVMGHDGEPLVSPLAIVMLWKDEQQLDPDDSNHIKDGQYSIKGLHPGKYRLAAIDALEVADYGSAESEEALNKALKAASVEVEVKEGERVVKDLKVLGKEILHGK